MIAGKFEVAKFIDIIKPKKWEFRVETLGLTLISLGDPQKRIEIQKELCEKFPDKHVHYTKEYKSLLKKLCKKQGYKIDTESIINAIKESLRNKSNGKISIHAENVNENIRKLLN